MKSSALEAFLEYPSLCTLIIKTLTIFRLPEQLLLYLFTSVVVDLQKSEIASMV
jgi:hypothetical protein